MIVAIIMGSTQYSDDIILSILKTTEELNRLKDIDTILDRILLESRLLSNADAGSIFIKNGDSLMFSHGYPPGQGSYREPEGLFFSQFFSVCHS